MNTAENRLIELVSDYYHGLLTRESYRAQRAELLDGLLLGPEEEPAPEVIDDEESITIPGAEADPGDTVKLRQPDVVTPGPDRTKLFVGLGGAVVAVIVVLVWAMSGPGPEEQTAGAPPPAVTESAEAATDRVRQSLGELLATEEWSQDVIAAFMYEWDELTEGQQQEARNSVWFLPLINELRSRIQFEKAVGADDQATSPGTGESLLVSFAAELELDSLVAGVQQEPEVGMPVTGDEEVGAESLESGDTAEALARMIEAEKASESEAIPDRETEASAEPEAEAGVTIAATQPVRTDPTPAPVVAEPPPKQETTPVRQPARDTPPEPSRPPSRAAPEKQASPVTARADETRPAASEAPAGPATKPAAGPDACRAELLKSRRRVCWDLLPDGAKGPVMAVLAPDSFVMGDDDDQTARPSHEVRIAQPFAISVWEISFAEYRKFCGASGHECPRRAWDADDYPVVEVSWKDAVAYTNWLSEVTGRSYRLPSEAEWEFAARGGTRTRFPFGDEILPTDARFSFDGTQAKPLPKSDRTTQKNGFKLWQVAGNVREWVLDTWNPDHGGAPADGSARTGSGTQRVVRGGSYADGADSLRSAARTSLDVATRDNYTGFRVVQDIDVTN